MCASDCASPGPSSTGSVCEDSGYDYACAEGPSYGRPPPYGATVSYESCCCDRPPGGCSTQIFAGDKPLRCR